MVAECGRKKNWYSVVYTLHSDAKDYHISAVWRRIGEREMAPTKLVRLPKIS